MSRFSKHKKVLICLQNIILINAIESKYENIIDAVRFYLMDLGSCESIIEGKWKIWVKKWKICDLFIEKIPINVMTALKVCQFYLFPNMHILLKILCTIPFTTATVERSFPTLRRLKTYIRNQYGNASLTGLALMTIHWNIKLNINEIVSNFMKKQIEKWF